jgi:cardiolipin synthase
MSQLHWVGLALLTTMQIGAALHALLYKRDPRSATGWVAVSLMFPVAGPILYFLFGINRIQTRARVLDEAHSFHLRASPERREDEAEVSVTQPQLPSHYVAIARISAALARRPLVAANKVEALHNGEQAYPAMLDAIHAADTSVFLASYIFQADHTGERFVEALAAASARGVDVRVLVDGVGALYSLPRTVVGLLRRRRVPVARFLPPRLLPPAFTVNLRTHRKILVIDGQIGFAGGLNIADRHLASAPPPPERSTDVHFRLIGPIAAQLEHAFLEDWAFATGDRTLPPLSHAFAERPPPPGAEAVCRVVTDGPDSEIEKLAAILVGAVAAARRRVIIVTPYFIPSREMSSALQTAALRGVTVDVVLPARNNLPYVHWATRNMLWELLRQGVRVHYQPPPFSHTKIFLVDERFSLLGSANIDPRSLRLNFEVGIEVYDRTLATTLRRHVDRLIATSRRVTFEEVEGRSLPIRIRDSLAWLLSPYL